MNSAQQNDPRIMTSRRPSALRFSPTAWAKLLFLRDAGDTEIGGFGIASQGDLLFIDDLRLVEQTCTWTHVEFDDASVAELFDAEVDAGRRPEQFGRVWVHSHPGTSAQPSCTDERTFDRVFGRCDWAVMFILARGGQSYARLRFNVGPGTDVLIPVEVDYTKPFGGSDISLWQQEYLAHVHVPPPLLSTTSKKETWKDIEADRIDDWWSNAWDDYAEFQALEEAEDGDIRNF